MWLAIIDLTLLLSVVVTVAVVILSERNYNKLAQLPHADALAAATPEGHWHNWQRQVLPSVAVIVPARNEATVIERVVGSLKELRYPDVQITVVDDSSTDDTSIRAQALGAAVLRLNGNPPPGWTGKCNACDRGARHATADWLLFTDADTVHTPDSLRRAVLYAEQQGLDALSLLLRQECGTFWERTVLPLAYQTYFATLRPARPAFNGQYILIRRSVYEQSSGFGAVRGRVMEDVALANHLSAQGYRIELANGHSAASVRMYQDLPSLLRGMTKTAFSAARDRGWEGLLLALSTLLGALVLCITLLALISGTVGLVVAGAVCIAASGLGLYVWLRRFDVRPAWLYAILNPVGLLIMFWIGFSSTMRVLSGRGVRWKGRTIIEPLHASEAAKG